jgi:hypothetical protein
VSFEDLKSTFKISKNGQEFAQQVEEEDEGRETCSVRRKRKGPAIEHVGCGQGCGGEPDRSRHTGHQNERTRKRRR